MNKWQQIVSLVKGSEALEFGGPTELFHTTHHNMMLYPELKSVDGANIFEDNHFQKEKMNDNFKYYHSKKPGTRYNVDAASESDIKIIDKKYDLVISSHQIEHIANPIKAIKLWKDVLKESGKVLAVLPNKMSCFDHKRPTTTIQHLLEDYNNNTSEDDTTHIQEQIDLHDWSRGGLPNFNELAKQNHKTRVVHHHCYDLQLVKDMFEYAGYKTIECVQLDFYPLQLVYLGEK